MRGALEKRACERMIARNQERGTKSTQDNPGKSAKEQEIAFRRAREREKMERIDRESRDRDRERIERERE